MITISTRHVAAAICLAAVLALTGDAARAGTPGEMIRRSGVRGGLIVHVGAPAGTDPAPRPDGPFIAQTLLTDRDAVRSARARLAGQGRCGPASVLHFDGRSLPYAENLVNLLIVHDHGRTARGSGMERGEG